MFARLLQSGLPVMAQWAEGIVFVHFPLIPDTNDLMENYLKGKIFWSSVNFASMPKYTPTIKVGGFEVSVLDVSQHPVMLKVAKWLRKNARKEETKQVQHA